GGGGGGGGGAGGLGPTGRADGRLYGRGVVDDKAGIALHAAALRAWLEARGGLPINAKVIVEGEEEIGSSHLAEFLKAHRERLARDVVLVSRTPNPAAGGPPLATPPRGAGEVLPRLRGPDPPVHHGLG